MFYFIHYNQPVVYYCILAARGCLFCFVFPSCLLIDAVLLTRETETSRRGVLLPWIEALLGLSDRIPNGEGRRRLHMILMYNLQAKAMPFINFLQKKTIIWTRITVMK